MPESTKPPQLPPAGWYADPDKTPGLRWWDGSEWTKDRRQSSFAARTSSTSDLSRPVQEHDTPPAKTLGTSQGTAPRPKWSREHENKAIKLTLAAVAVALLIYAGAVIVTEGSFGIHLGNSTSSPSASRGANPIPEHYAPAPEATEEVECQTFGRETFCQKLP